MVLLGVLVGIEANRKPATLQSKVMRTNVGKQVVVGVTLDEGKEEQGSQFEGGHPMTISGTLFFLRLSQRHTSSQCPRPRVDSRLH
jgi:hypothetical protein